MKLLTMQPGSQLCLRCKSLTSTETFYTKTESEAIGRLDGLEKFHHYCFALDFSQANHDDRSTKPSTIDMFKKYLAATASHKLAIQTDYHETRIHWYNIPGICITINVMESHMDSTLIALATQTQP